MFVKLHHPFLRLTTESLNKIMVLLLLSSSWALIVYLAHICWMTRSLFVSYLHHLLSFLLYELLFFLNLTDLVNVVSGKFLLLFYVTQLCEMSKINQSKRSKQSDERTRENKELRYPVTNRLNGQESQFFFFLSYSFVYSMASKKTDR
jgi:hypothetical protein